VDPLEGNDWAQDAADTLEEDESIVAALSPALWDKYAHNFRCFIADAIEGWAMEGRVFATAAAKKAAVGALVLGTRAEVAKDPEAWIRAHCDRR